MYARVEEMYKASSLIQDLNRALMNMDIIEAMKVSYEIDQIIAQVINRDTVAMAKREQKKHYFEPHIIDGDIEWEYK